MLQDSGLVHVFIVVILLVFALLFVVVPIISVWRVFTKAGQPGWASIVPFYNAYILLKIVGRPGWWLALYFVPGVNIVISMIVLVNLATAFRKGGWFAVLLVFYPWIGLPILAFGSSAYHGAGFVTYGQGGTQPEPGYPPPPQYPPQQHYPPY